MRNRSVNYHVIERTQHWPKSKEKTWLLNVTRCPPPVGCLFAGKRIISLDHFTVRTHTEKTGMTTTTYPSIHVSVCKCMSSYRDKSVQLSINNSSGLLQPKDNMHNLLCQTFACLMTLFMSTIEFEPLFWGCFNQTITSIGNGKWWCSQRFIIQIFIIKYCVSFNEISIEIVHNMFLHT